MKLRGIDFGNVLGASGVQGFFGEGYWFHACWRPFGLNLSDVTFVAKTATLLPRWGNMPLTLQHTPKQIFPRCVKVRLRRGVMLNAVGLSNPGLLVLLYTGRWQRRNKPFWLSVMPVGETPALRIDELRRIVDLLGHWKSDFSAPFGLQINLSCPNTEHDPGELIRETADALSIARTLGVPLMPKFSIASAPIRAVLELNDHPDCDAICVSNTIPFGWGVIDWSRSWGKDVSPLADLGGGGLSGSVLRPLVCEWITQLRDLGFAKPINGGGGILRPNDANHYQRAGASSIFIGSAATLRPWRVRSIVNRANSLSWR